jgi:hypothetical protein
MRRLILVTFACMLQILLPLSLRSRALTLNVDNPQDFRLLGFLPGQTDFMVVEERLGHAKHFYAHRGIGSRPPMVCYVASTPDHTRITFTREEESQQLREFQVSTGNFKTGWEANCSNSELITEDIATDSGLKLGMSKTDVIARYGQPKPTSDAGTIMFASDRPLTERELRNLCGHAQYCTKDRYGIYGELDCTFRNGRLVSFDIYRGITT